jgi:hypothetical protein
VKIVDGNKRCEQKSQYASGHGECVVLGSNQLEASRQLSGQNDAPDSAHDGAGKQRCLTEGVSEHRTQHSAGTGDATQ